MFNQPATHKKVLETFRRIDELNKKKKLKIEFPNSPANGKPIEVWKSGNYFEFSTNIILPEIDAGYSTIFDISSLISNTKEYHFFKGSMNSCVIDFKRQLTTGKLTSIIESIPKKSESSYMRFIQPIKGNSKIAYIEGAVILAPEHSNQRYFGLNQFTIECFEFDVFTVDIEKQRFILIDSRSKIDFEKFKNITDSFFAAYAFVFEDIVGEESYLISTDDHVFEKISQIIFNTKPDSYFGNSYPIFDRKMPLQDGLSYFPKSVFETICNSYLTAKSFARTLDIINEALQSALPLTKCVLFSAALETISSLINKNNKGTKPVDDDSLKKGKLIEKIEDLVSKDEYLNDNEKSFLIDKKIKYLNSPTNSAKAREAFKYFNEQLPDSLLNVLAYRNDYFHGSIPKGEQFGFKVANLIRAYEIQFLTCILVLKFCNYSGYVQNKSAIMEYHALRKDNATEKIRLKQALTYKI
jgi:hypothetical protein